MHKIKVNGREVRVGEGTTLAAAILASGDPFRTSVRGEARAPLCGIGICFECRVTVNGQPHVRSCTVLAEDGMEIVTGE
ncbi:MAG: (2Fe-2S)-binding protein [Acidobacteria bacterium]|nr:(2Fe-2S)-binding protein [Acidobacteriota bacterium]